MTFQTCIAVDWSGAKGRRLPGVQAAWCRGGGAPELIDAGPGKYWSRAGFFDWCAAFLADNPSTLIGFDFCFALPFVDCGAYLPGFQAPAETPAALWHLVERECQGEEEFYAGRFVRASQIAPYFRSPGRIGAKYARRLRAADRACRAQGLGRPESPFNLIGARQVGLGSFAGMRFLSALRKVCPGLTVWPFERIGAHTAPVAVEIYPNAFFVRASVGSGKAVGLDRLGQALGAFGQDRRGIGALDPAARNFNDQADALVSAAALQALAGCSEFWDAGGEVAHTRMREGWIFGVL